nr:MAG TPA: hypothetical protein [Caudoviricetes sp.]
MKNPIVKRAHGFFTFHFSFFTPPSCFPPSSHFQSFHRPPSSIHPLQKLRLNSCHRSLLLYQLEERRATEGTRTKIKAEVSTSVKASLRLRHLWNGR